MALIDEVRMDKTFFEALVTDNPGNDDKEFWRSKTIPERLQALELIRQIIYGYDPDTARIQRVLEVLRYP